MRLHDACLAMCSWIRSIQEFDPAYKDKGDAFPEFKSEWSDKLFSVIYTQFGRLPAPRMSDTTSQTSLKGRFMAALENRSCRLNYQESAVLLEKILDDALEKHGEEKVASLATRGETTLWGHDFVPLMQQAGIKFSDPARLDRLFRKAQDIGKRQDQNPGFKPV